MLIVSVMAVAALLVGVDQLTKWWAVGVLSDGTVIPVWPEVFELRYTENRGAAFGMLQNQQWLFSVITVLLIAVVLYLLAARKLPRHFLVTAASTLIVAGGVGNLIDRVINGYVVDFLYFRLIDFPIFNFADICVCAGAAAGIIYLLFFDSRKPTEDTHGKEDTALVMRDDGAETGQAAGGNAGGNPVDGTEVDGAGAGDLKWETADQERPSETGRCD